MLSCCCIINFVKSLVVLCVCVFFSASTHLSRQTRSVIQLRTVVNTQYKIKITHSGEPQSSWWFSLYNSLRSTKRVFGFVKNTLFIIFNRITNAFNTAIFQNKFEQTHRNR